MSEIRHSDFDIFVCDDDLAILNMHLDGLGSLKLKARGFESGVDLLKVLQVEVPRLIVTDHHMPKLTGLEMTREIRARGILLPVILITGDQSPKIREEADLIEGCTYLTKSFNVEAFTKAVISVLERAEPLNARTAKA